MKRSLIALPAAAAAAALALPPTSAAHHGWGWTQDAESRLTGEILSITFTNPHMHLRLRDTMGMEWSVDLSPPIVAERSGFGADHAAAGDRATVTGHRARDMSVRSFKGETITVRGRTFDVYPQREKTLSPTG
ncbi:DUF6152 family protein [Altererythrobacter sp. KTW20L]|uniref:DUF6152 family protein n=1 Tax=Altererythrobacter sp. KTW20L TaxID=2942210 RepID=UPI0020BD6335|nr:DUF6152 family protein [Altererythrobacter sp. KTW20L]MCL6250490.1 DUF6152 family protein [Altererythrobacter sp. KTW20L]